MNGRVPSWIKKEKVKLLAVILISIFNIIALFITHFNNGCINTAFLFFGIVFFIYLLIKNYKKTHKISVVYLIGINIIPMINFFCSYNIIFPMCLLLIRGILFMTVVVSGLVAVWLAKTKIKERFTPYLVVSLLAVILNFGGLYESLYSMYSPYGQEGLEINQDMTYAQAIMPVDFIYYSADAFFGTDISDVSIKYIDYMKWYEENSMEKKHLDKYEGAISIYCTQPHGTGRNMKQGILADWIEHFKRSI